MRLTHKLYYHLKPLIPRWIQIEIRREFIRRKRVRYADIWPIDESAAGSPAGWQGWPEGKRFALVLTHDIETFRGHEKCLRLAELEAELGFRSSFNFVPEEYPVSPELRDHLRRQGFEVGVHGLKHRQNIFRSKRTFLHSAARINHYLAEWKAAGFRSPSMYHNLDWIGHLNIKYDASTFDTDPFEPQPDGMQTIFPFWVPARGTRKGYVELPYTLPQDFSLFILLQEKNIGIWKQKLDWIARHGGMALLNTHPDYMFFNGGKGGKEEYPVGLYLEFLEYVRSRYGGEYWSALPEAVADFWREAQVKKGLRSVPRKRMRACMLTYSFYESDNRVMRYAESLAKRGDVVDVIALQRNGYPKFETLRGVNLYRIQKRATEEKGKYSYLSRLARFLVGSAIFLTRAHLKNPYHLVHVHSIPDFEVFAAFFPKLAGAKLILDIHDIVPELYASKFGIDSNHPVFKGLVTVERLSAGFSDHVIISNHLWKERLLSRSVPEEKCSVILNYPDPALFYPRRRTRKDGRFIMMYPGTLNWHQGLDIAIRAMSVIRERVPQAELHIYGRGSEMQNLAGLIERLRLEDRVFLNPPMPIDRIVEKMAEADLGIIPKRNDPFGGEAFSTKILEFMALGVPVVIAGTKIDRYYFNDSVVKFFKADDKEDLAKAMLEMIENYPIRMALAQNALRFVEEFSWARKKLEYLELVEHLTGIPSFS